MISMRKLPIVSIIGRPNVGKSSLFNRIVHRRAAVVDDVAGSTRDRNYVAAEWDGCRFELVDTGGLIPTSREAIPKAIHRQVDIAIEESTAVVFVVEAGTGVTDLDLMIARRIRKAAGDKIILAVNKSESKNVHLEIDSFRTLGLGDPHPVSALHGYGTGDLLDMVVARIREVHPDSESCGIEEPLKIAVVGRPNAGKSSLVNNFLREDRMIVDSVPGTTRDAVDSSVVYHGRAITIIDTAGLRKKSHVTEDVEYYCNLRALDSIKRSDICILVIDTLYGIGEQDLKIMEKVTEMRKGCVIAWNKWDTVRKDTKTFDALRAETQHRFVELHNIPMIATSALTGQRVPVLLDQALEVQQRMSEKIPSGELSDKLHEWSKIYPHPLVANKPVRLLGIKQKPTWFPLFLVFATNYTNATAGYQRYLTNKIYETWDFEGCPVIVEFRPISRPRKSR
jgi:GTP-binding protein